MISEFAWNWIIRVAALRYSSGMSSFGPNARGPARSLTVSKSMDMDTASGRARIPVNPSMGGT